jgi:hypothetical protein
MKRGILLVKALKAESLEQQAMRLAVEVKLDQLVLSKRGAARRTFQQVNRQHFRHSRSGQPPIDTPWSELKFTNGVSQEEVEEGRGFVGGAGGVERR